METGAVFSPKNKKVNYKRKCAVKGCNSCPTKDRNVVFHTFPKENENRVFIQTSTGKIWRDRLSVWLEKCNIKSEDARVTSFVCSRHFTIEDYSKSGHANQKKMFKRLKKTACPSRNLPTANAGNNDVPTACPAEEVQSVSCGTLQKRCETPKRAAATPSTCSVNTVTPKRPRLTCESPCEGNSSQDVVEPIYKDVGIQCNIEADLNLKHDISVQTYVPLDQRFYPVFTHGQSCSGTVSVSCPSNPEHMHVTNCVAENETVTEPLKSNVSDSVIKSPCKHDMRDFITSDIKLLKLTGIPNLNIFNKLVAAYNHLKQSKSTMTADCKILLLFIKLRLNLPFSVLAILFNISEPSAKRMFVESLDVCQTILDALIYWPSKSEILSNLPICFQKYHKVRVILDATEIKTTRTKCIVCHCKSYSHYKGCYTCKFLLGVTPAGLFSFVSRSYGGRVSDKAIFEHSNLILKLEPNVDDIMVDKGVAIKKICEQHGIGLVHPPFLSKRAQLSKSEAQENVGVAAARVHVERAIERVKKFRIFKGTLPWNMIRYSEAMMRLICAMVNLSSPILADDKFGKRAPS